MRNVRLTVQYDGTDYAGFAPQPNAVSIHARLMEAIAATTGEEPQLAAAGRTDAGVHARGQVVSFLTASRIPMERFPAALNMRLPRDIRVMAAAAAPPTFHARFSALSKVYVYTIDNGPVPSPLWSRYAAHEARPLDLAAMQAAAAVLQGRHDFAAFRSTGGAAKTSTRHLMRLEVRAEPLGIAAIPDPAPAGRLIRIIAEADGFLYNMVRILAGTLLEVGWGRRSVDQVAEALRTGRRELAGKTAPPQGLCLEYVRYE